MLSGQRGNIKSDAEGKTIQFELSCAENPEQLALGKVIEYETDESGVQKVWCLGTKEEVRNSANRQRNEQYEERKRNGGPLSLVKPTRDDYRIETLSPSEKWILFIDETGDAFTKSEKGPGFITDLGERGLMGKFVGVLIPLEAKLPELSPDIHFADMNNIDEMDQIVQDLLDQPVGIWGVSVDSLPETKGQRWVDGVMHVVSWVLRLLPLAESPCELEIVVENRGEHSKSSDWEALLRTIISGLSETNPERYSKIHAKISIEGKRGGKWEKQHAYVDAIAHSWGSPAKDAKARLEASGLRGTCLHEGNGETLIKIWDLLKEGTTLDASDWQKLLHDQDLSFDASLSSTLLSQVAESCRTNRDLWRKYLDATVAHLESKAIDLFGLGKEVAWLDSCMPTGEAIPELLELYWLTAQLENGNHMGAIEFQDEAKLTELSDKLFEESPQPVCQADLAIAVLETNRFDFETASSALARWEEFPMVVAGRRHWSRLQSSHGQHAAFRGDLVSARESFLVAIDGFEGLSDDDDAFREISQTSCYLAIASMDDPEVDEKDVREAVARVTGELDAKRIGELAKSTDPSEKFAHHLLLRFLRCRGCEEDRLSYVSEKDQWGVDEGHPWPLIQAYRGILLHPKEPARAVERMVEASRMALDPKQGPTVRMIGLTLGIIAMGWGAKSMVTEQDLDQIENLLPAAKERVALLREALSNLFECSEELLEGVLPFNFR